MCVQGARLQCVAVLSSWALLWPQCYEDGDAAVHTGETARRATRGRQAYLYLQLANASSRHTVLFTKRNTQTTDAVFAFFFRLARGFLLHTAVHTHDAYRHGPFSSSLSSSSSSSSFASSSSAAAAATAAAAITAAHGALAPPPAATAGAAGAAPSSAVKTISSWTLPSNS